jgi:hypothetical protein
MEQTKCSVFTLQVLLDSCSLVHIFNRKLVSEFGVRNAEIAEISFCCSGIGDDRQDPNGELRELVPICVHAFPDENEIERFILIPKNQLAC